MWLKVGHAYLNLDNVADVRFVLNEERTLTANVEMVSGHLKHFQDLDAEALQKALDALSAGPP